MLQTYARAERESTVNSSVVCVISAAIHFGQERTQCGLSFKSDPTIIQCLDIWLSWPIPLASTSTPTCVLINSQKQFDSFGFEAEEKYFNLTANGEHHGWMLFKGFTSAFWNSEVCLYLFNTRAHVHAKCR